MTQEPMADPHCLIIQVQPPILAEERPNRIEVRKKINENEMLDKKGVPQFFCIMAVGYSGAGNIKITMTHTSKVSDLMKYGKDIVNIIMKNGVLLILPDTEHYCIKINKVLTWCRNNEPMSIDMIHKELCTYLPSVGGIIVCHRTCLQSLVSGVRAYHQDSMKICISFYI